MGYTQSPGDVGGDLSIWLKSNVGTWTNAGATTAASNGNRISNWEDQSGNSNDAINYSGSDRPRLRDNETDNINFINPVIDFDGFNDLLTGSAGHYTDDIFTVVIPKADISRFSGGVYYMTGDISGGRPYGSYSYLGAGNNSTFNEVVGIGMGDQFDYQEAYASTNDVLREGVPYIVNSRHNASNTNQAILLNGLTVNNTSVGSFLSTNNEQYVLGDLYRTVSAHANVKLGEVIIYSNRNGTLNRRKIQSYLAIKYGITLDQSAGGEDYYKADGTIVYPASSTYSSYNNDIAGVGRDDDSALNQTKSKSVNIGSDVTMVKNTITSDENFVVWGNNGVSIASVNTTNVPGIIDTRLNKEWRVYETGNITLDSIYIDLTGATGALDMNNLAILVDDDGDFSDAQILIDGFNVNGNVVSFTGIDFDNSSASYFTIGSSTIPLPVKFGPLSVQRLNTNEVKIDWITLEEINNDYFMVQVSKDGIEWTDIAKIKGSGNSSNPIQYSTTDFMPFEGISYYRISQTDFDGKTESSRVVSVSPKSIEASFSVSPNPNNGDFRLTGKVEHLNQIEDINIYNIVGKPIEFNESDRKISLNSVPVGVYIAVIKLSNGTIKNFKFIIE